MTPGWLLLIAGGGLVAGILSAFKSALQDLLAYALKGLALYAVEGRKVGVNDHEVNVFTVQALFSTLTNVNFDPARFVPLVNRTVALREALKAKVKAAGGKVELGDKEHQARLRAAGNSGREARIRASHAASRCSGGRSGSGK